MSEVGRIARGKKRKPTDTQLVLKGAGIQLRQFAKTGGAVIFAAMLLMGMMHSCERQDRIQQDIHQIEQGRGSANA